MAIAAIASACGGGSSKAAASAPTSTTAPSAGSRSANRAQFTQCLESHGVPASAATSFGLGRRGAAPGSTPTSVPTTRPTVPSQYQAAFTACRSLLPAGPFGGGALNSPAGAAYRNCLQVHGVTLPTAPAQGSGGGSAGQAPAGGFGSLFNNPAYQAARQACASLLPSTPGDSGGAASTTVPAS